MPKRKTQEEATSDLLLRGFILKSKYGGISSRVLVECVKCNHTWESEYKPLMLSRSGCPECNRQNKCLTRVEVIDKLQKQKILLFGDYISSGHPTMFNCMINSDHVWETTPTSILHNGSGCPFCAGNVMYTKSDIQQQLRDDIEIVGEYGGMNNKTTFRCGKGHTWKTSPNNLIHHNRKCPVCHPYVHGKGFGRRVVVNNILFRSEFEAKCYEYLITKYKDDLILQKRYPDGSRRTCDFFIPSQKKWIEVSTFTNKKYLNQIKQKRQMIETIREQFVFVSSLTDLHDL